MSVRLQKGQKVSLSKDHAGLSKVLIGLGWDEAKRSGGGFFSRKPKPIDCDASAFLLKNGKLADKTDIVYYGNLQHKSGAVQHLGDNLTGAGEGDDEQIVVCAGGIRQDGHCRKYLRSGQQETALWNDRERVYPAGGRQK